MKSISTHGMYRVTAFFLIAVVTAAVIGFAVEGWRTTVSANGPNPSDGQNSQNTIQTPNDLPNNQDPITPPVPQHTHYITGEEIDASRDHMIPITFVVDSGAPLYGVSDSLLTVELPVEDGKTRYLVYTDNALDLGKIGSILPSRAYIANMLQYFGGIAICNGFDDVIEYNGWDAKNSTLDVSKNSSFCYTENGARTYTYGYLINRGLEELAMQTVFTEEKALPYTFNPFHTAPIIGAAKAKSVILPYGSTNETELYYSETENTYFLSKSGVTQTDLLNEKHLSYHNVFVLFADAVTYEKANGTEMVLDTISGGTGYYISEGTLTRITWSVDASGNMSFMDTAGKKLTINRGNSYIGFFKASQKNSVRFG